MSEEKKLTAEELEGAAGGISGDVTMGSAGGDQTVLDQSVIQNTGNLVNDKSSTVNTKVDSKVQVKNSLF